MKLCIFKESPDDEYMFSGRLVSVAGYLYYLPIIGYKKHLLKGNVIQYDYICAYVCFHY